MFQKHNIALLLKPGYTLRQALVDPKDKLSSDGRQRPIYFVRCEGCDGEYVGVNERKLSTRMKEHRTPVVKGYEKSALSTHNLRIVHTFDWDHAEVVDILHTRYVACFSARM